MISPGLKIRNSSGILTAMIIDVQKIEIDGSITQEQVYVPIDNVKYWRRTLRATLDEFSHIISMKMLRGGNSWSVEGLTKDQFPVVREKIQVLRVDPFSGLRVSFSFITLGSRVSIIPRLSVVNSAP